MELARRGFYYRFYGIHGDDQWTVPRTIETVWTRAITFNKSVAGKLLKKEYWGECESSRPVGEIVDQLLGDIPYPSRLAKVYLCPATRGASLVQITNDNIHKPIKQLDLHRGKLADILGFIVLGGRDYNLDHLNSHLYSQSVVKMGCKPSKSAREMDTAKATARFELLQSLCSNVSPVEKTTLPSKGYTTAIENYRHKIQKKKQLNRETSMPEDHTLFEVSTRIKEQNFDE